MLVSSWFSSRGVRHGVWGGDMHERARNGVLLPMAATTALCTLAAMLGTPPSARAQSLADTDATRLLSGAIDIHLHIEIHVRTEPTSLR